MHVELNPLQGEKLRSIKDLFLNQQTSTTSCESLDMCIGADILISVVGKAMSN